MNFKETSFSNNSAKIIINKPGIKEVFHHLDEDTVKIEFILDKYQKIEVFKLKKFQDKPNRVVVDIFWNKSLKKKKKQQSGTQQKKIIVIDPGHADPGAVGKKENLREKCRVSIGREIKKANL